MLNTTVFSLIISYDLFCITQLVTMSYLHGLPQSLFASDYAEMDGAQ